MNIYSDLARHQIIKPVKKSNKIIEITKRADGSLAATQANGKRFVISQDHEDFQVFLVWTMLNGETSE